MKSAAVRHLFAVLCLVVAAASQLCPVFSAKALFSRALLAPEPSFSFQAPEGFTGEKSVRFLSKGVSQDEENKLVVDGGLDGAFGAEFPPPGR